MRRNTTLAAALLAFLTVLAGCAGGAGQTAEEFEAACAFGPPQTEPQRASPGGVLRIHEEGFAADCYDTGQGGRPPPERDVLVGLRQGEKEWRLATVDAGPPPSYAIDARLTVPEDAEPGRAVVEIHTRLSAEPFEVPLIVVGGEALPDTGGRR
jgi:hypothetical protein